MDRPQNILIRADSSYKIGTGHIMRDLVLASQYKEANIIFATQELEGNINHKIREAGYNLEIVNSNNKDDLLGLIENLHVDLLIIDNYDIYYETEKYIKEKTGVKILALDDTYEKHYCDILLNHNISANPKKYINLVPEDCELRCGAKYTLLRDEFIEEKKKKEKLIYGKNKTVFLAMGGADHSNINIEILKVLEKFDNIKVNLVTTTANKNLTELELYVQNKNWINLHVNSDKIAELMRVSCLAIVTPSVILNEVNYMEVPFIAIKTADNQDDMYRYMKKQKNNILEKFNAEILQSTIQRMVK